MTLVKLGEALVARSRDASPEIRHKAELVQYDLNLLARLTRDVPSLRRLALRNVEELEAMLRSETVVSEKGFDHAANTIRQD